MVTNAVQVQVGVMVRDADGEEVGHVARVWPYVPESKADGPPVAGQPPAAGEDMGYFSIDRGGFAGLGVTHFYLPLRAVGSVEQDGTIRLDCALSECEETYKQEPWFANRDIV